MHFMDHPTDDEMPRRHGIADRIKGLLIGLLGATRDKVEEVSAEVQHRAFRLLWMIVWSLVGAVSLWLALCFAMLTVIFGFDLPPRYAFGIPALVFVLVGGVSVLMFLKAKSAKRNDQDPD